MGTLSFGPGTVSLVSGVETAGIAARTDRGTISRHQLANNLRK